MSISYVVAQRVWDAFIAGCAVIAALYVPYELVFGGADAPLLGPAETFVTVVFGADIAVRYRRRDLPPVAGRAGLPPRTPARAARLALDALATLPMLALTGNIAWLWLRPLKLHRVAQMIRMLRNHEIRYAALVRLASFLFWLALATHWIACGWVALGGALPSGQGSAYVGALYWTVTTLTTVGYGDLTPVTDLQRLFTMGVMVLGVGMYGFVIGNIAHILMNIDPVRAGQLRRMEQLAAFMRYRKLPRQLQDRVADYYRYLWQQQMDHDESEILHRLPPSLQTELTLYLKRDLLEAVPLFDNVSEAFLREVALGMHPVIFLPGDCILRAGDRGRSMYFITRGQVDILTPEESRRIARLGTGDFFGEMALVFDEPRTAHVRAVDYCDVYRLEHELFDRLLSMHPEVAEQIRAAAMERRASGQP